MTGEALRDAPIVRIVSSPLTRALHAIARHHPKVPVETDARIMERHFGVLQGKVYRGPSQKPDDTEGIESREAMTSRLRAFYDDLRVMAARTPGTTVLVSHGGALSALTNTVLFADGHVELAPDVQPSRFWNCSISEIDLTSTPAVLRRWADVAHLTDPSRVVNVDEGL
ncbi:hypothetical protein CBS9595_001751 [Malassezia furfur]|nr:hypothetical protein CBS9595_001751 [Malassezia furfur]